MIDLRELRHLLIEEISKAEIRVIDSVEFTLEGAREEEITGLFAVEAERGLRAATESGRVATAVQFTSTLRMRIAPVDTCCR